MAIAKVKPKEGRRAGGAGHEPYVADKEKMPELTWSALALGTVLGIVFGASSLYLVLKVGMTVSASIPVAVLSITLFRLFSKMFGIRRATILENNIVQTTGSAGESIAFGVGVTMPAMMLLGFEMDIGRVMVVSVLGGLLGILMMIPLRRAFIVKQHGRLKYPEGTACADVLIVGEQGGSSAKTVFLGFGVAFVYQVLMQGLRLWKDVPSRALSWYKGASVAMEVNPALLGVGYIIGTRISCVMAAGGVLASLVLIPAIRLFGDGLAAPIFPATTLIRNMDEEAIWQNYVLYIGAGAVAAGGIISLVQALPLIGGSIAAGLRDMRLFRGKESEGHADNARTDRDLPLWFVGIGMLILVGAIWGTSPLHAIIPGVPQLHMNLVGAVLIVLFGFLFVTVSSRLTGEIGSSSNPISGMTVATLLLTCLIFLLLGWTKLEDRLTALSIAAVVCIAASNGGTTSQDLKTGFLVGATPRAQQLAILVGALTSAMVIGVILVVLNAASTIYSTQNLPRMAQPLDVSKLPDRAKAPDDDKYYHVWHAIEGNPYGVPQGKYLIDEAGQIRYLVDPGINGRLDRRDNGNEVVKFKAPKARLMSLITDGMLTGKLPWSLVLIGVFIAVVLELCGVPSLPFAVGVYLPMAASTPILIGGLVRFVADRWGRSASGEARSEAESDMSSGVLLSTGYIAGGAIAGVLIAFLSFSDTIPQMLSVWQYRTETISSERYLNEVSLELAQKELGQPVNLNEPPKSPEVIELAQYIRDLNADLLVESVVVPAGTILQLPDDGKQYPAPKQMYLGEIAEQTKNSGKARLIWRQNQGRLQKTETIRPGSQVKLPQHTWPAVAAFGALAVLLLAVGLGWLLRGEAVAAEPVAVTPKPGT